MTTHQDRVAVVTGEDSYFVTGQTIMADGGLVRH
jgi:hypothetical protein